MDKFQFTQLQLECTTLFQDNPYMIDTKEGIAIRLGRKIEHISFVLDKLVQLSILEKIGDGEKAIFRYIEPKVTKVGVK